MSRKYSSIRMNSTNVRIKRIKQNVTTRFLGFMWRWAPGLTRRYLFNQFFSPIRHPLTAAQRRILEKGTRFTIQVNGKTVECWKWGSGPTILFAHGWNGRGVHFHHFFEPLLARGLSAMVFDAPAHGESEGLTTNYFEFTDTVRALFNSGHGKTIQGVVAHSLGGAAVINALAKEGLALNTVLIAPALKLKELMYNTFNYYGIPSSLYRSTIAELEKRHGYNLDQDNPYGLAKQLPAGFLIIQDRDDATVSYTDSKKLAAGRSHIMLRTTAGLGHKRVISDVRVIDDAIGYLANPVKDDKRLRQKA